MSAWPPASACWCIPDEQHDVGDFHYAQARSTDGLYHAPALWLWELGNTLTMAYRRNRLPKVHFERGLELASLALIIGVVCLLTLLAPLLYPAGAFVLVGPPLQPPAGT